MAEIPQYKSEMSTSNGAAQRERLFLIKNKVGERGMSESKAMMNVR